jgi:hypothetical protein
LIQEHNYRRTTDDAAGQRFVRVRLADLIDCSPADCQFTCIGRGLIGVSETVGDTRAPFAESVQTAGNISTRLNDLALRIAVFASDDELNNTDRRKYLNREQIGEKWQEVSDACRWSPPPARVDTPDDVCSVNHSQRNQQLSSPARRRANSAWVRNPMYAHGDDISGHVLSASRGFAVLGTNNLARRVNGVHCQTVPAIRTSCGPQRRTRQNAGGITVCAKREGAGGGKNERLKSCHCYAVDHRSAAGGGEGAAHCILYTEGNGSGKRWASSGDFWRVCQIDFAVTVSVSPSRRDAHTVVAYVLVSVDIDGQARVCQRHNAACLSQ